MFQDERINKESGRIYRNCILFSLVIILMICIVKFIYYASIKEFQFPYIIAEVVLLLDSIAILGIGELHLVTKIKDELFYYKRYKYYKKAILVYLSIGLLGFAIALPFEYNNHFMDISSQSLLIHLESFGFLFLVFSFKRARINFNYSFIEENNTIYWKKVAWNIFKLFLLHIVFLVVSLIFNIVIVGHNYLNIFKFFAVSFLSLAFIYILISFVERVSNDCIVNEKKNNALLIVGGLPLFIYFVYFISQ
ncbi:MAG: hypothetical protein K2K50_08350 [Anaeroplasmataceae bacterium]|nr:hypothetical protein [Anaeroplasmataceae bacterium]